MPTPYNISPTTRGVNGYALPFPEDIFNITFAASTGASVTCPSSCALGALGKSGSPMPYENLASNATGRGYWIAHFNYGNKVPADIWVAVNATAAVPAGDSFASATSVVNPTAFQVLAGDVIDAITATVNAEMSVSFYYIQG